MEQLSILPSAGISKAALVASGAIVGRPWNRQGQSGWAAGIRTANGSTARVRKWQGIRRGWMAGGEEFRKELLSRMDQRVGLSHYGAELQESDEHKARGIIAEESRRLKFPTIHFPETSKGDARKVEIARRLRSERTVSLQWMPSNYRWAVSRTWQS